MPHPSIAALALLGQVFAPEDLPPTLRAEIPPGRMAIYDIRYSDAPREVSALRPPRLYIPASELEEPGVWGEGFRRTHGKRTVGVGPATYAHVPVDRVVYGWDANWGWGGGWGGGWSGGWGLGGGGGWAGVPALFDPCLFGLNERFFDPPTQNTLLSMHPDWLYQVQGCRPLQEDIWDVSGRWAYSLSRQRNGAPSERLPYPAQESVYTFDARRKLFTRAAVRGACLAEIAHGQRMGPRSTKALSLCSHWPPEPVNLEFLHRSTEPFPPADLAGRIDAALAAGSRYLHLRAREVTKAPWFAMHPAGTRAVVAWALLASGGEPGGARALIEEALGEPVRTTYDAAFLVLALDALLSWRAPAREAPPAGGRTSVAPGEPLDAFDAPAERARIEKALASAASFLAGAREKESGLWGYNRGGEWCPREADCLHATCWGDQPIRGKSIDVSNTFWALEALRVAARRGLPVPPRVFDQAVRSLSSWGSSFPNIYVPRYSLWMESPGSPEATRELLRERARRDRTLRLARRPRVRGEEPGGALPAPEPWEVEHNEVSLFPYTSLFVGGRADPLPDDTLYGTFGGTLSHTMHVAGVGALIRAFQGLGQDPLASRVVQQGLLLARLHFRLALAGHDLDWCGEIRKEHGHDGTVWPQKLQPRDPGYSFLLLERVLDDLGVEGFGSHEWYPLLALHSLDLQREDGGWYPWRGDRLVPTALHLLFLGRSAEPDLSGPLPSYEPLPVVTGKAAARPGPWQALVEGPGGRHHRVAEVIASLRRVGKEARIRLAEKGLETIPPGERQALAPLLEEIIRDGPAPSKAWARRALAEIRGGGARE